MKKLFIVIPAHNEEYRIEKTLKDYSSFFENLRKKKIVDYELFIVINATTDNTEGIIKRFKKKNIRINYVVYKEGGKGFAIIQGFRTALNKKNDFIGFVDADDSTKAEDFYKLFANIKNYDGAIASRWLKDSKITVRQRLVRRIFSRGFNFLVRAFFLMPYRDTQCGAKLFKREVIEKVIDTLAITKWAFDVDLLYKVRKKKFCIKEVPVSWEDDPKTKINLKRVPLQMFLGIVRLRILNSPFSFLIKAYDRLPEKIKLHHKII